MNTGTKPIFQSLTAVAVVLLGAFNIADETTILEASREVEVIMNSVLTLAALWGRYRATRKIMGVL